MTTEDREVLSALLDREPVDPVALGRALEDPEGRRTLVEFAILRRALQAPVPGEERWVDRHEPGAALARPRPARWRLVAAAGLFAVAAGGGMAAERYRSRERPPEPHRVVHLEFDPLATPRR